MTRDPIGSGHAFDDPARFNATDLNLYAYAGKNPQSMVDPAGLTAYSAEQVQRMLDDAVEEYELQGPIYGLIKSAENNSLWGVGKYDFQFNGADDTLEVPGLWAMNSADFGNYFAGYVNYGAFGEFGLRAALYWRNMDFSTGTGTGAYGFGHAKLADDDWDQVLIEQGSWLTSGFVQGSVTDER